MDEPTPAKEVDSPESASALFFTRAFTELYMRTSGRPPVDSLASISPILAIDPGGTSGIALFDKTHLSHTEQLNTSHIAWGIQRFHALIHEVHPRTIVIEDYRIYSWRTKQHQWSSLHTPRLIGVIECLCYQYQVPLIKQSAQQGKGFVTDDRLKEWNLYLPGQPHARDAVRHGCQYLLFGDLPLPPL
jgi:hypothetical protein